MAEEFSWRKVYRRRRVLADEIKSELGLTGFGLTDNQTFGALNLTDQNLASEPMFRVPFYVIAQRMLELTDHSHIIDHAWWLLSDDKVAEPWGFVTEPYSNLTETQRLASTLSVEMEDWGIEVSALPAAKSAWLPGRCTPIVTKIVPNNLNAFLRLGVGAALLMMAKHW